MKSKNTLENILIIATRIALIFCFVFYLLKNNEKSIKKSISKKKISLANQNDQISLNGKKSLKKKKKNPLPLKNSKSNRQ